jgi:cysteine synthase
LREHRCEARVVVADPYGSILAGLVHHGVPGPNEKYLVEGIGISSVAGNLDLAVIDDAITVTDDESFAMTRRLIREEGLYVGGSSGTAVAAAVKLAMTGSITRPIVAILADSWDRYRSCAWLG